MVNEKVYEELRAIIYKKMGKLNEIDDEELREKSWEDLNWELKVIEENYEYNKK